MARISDDSPRSVRVELPRRRVFHAGHRALYLGLHLAAAVRRHREEADVDQQRQADRQHEKDQLAVRVVCECGYV